MVDNKNLERGEQIQIARWLGENQSTLSMILSGDRNVSRQKALKLSKKTGVSLEIILSDNSEKRRAAIIKSWRAKCKKK